MGSISKLTPRQADFIGLFPAAGADLSIEVLYREFLGRVPEPHTTRRDMQQALGPWIKQINDGGSGFHVVPGRARGTYRIAG